MDENEQKREKLIGLMPEAFLYDYDGVEGNLVRLKFRPMGSWGNSDNGGTIEMGRVQVGPSPWKTALINIQLSGRLVFFKTISKQESIAESL